MSEKELSVTSIEDAKAKISDIQVFGDGDTFALLSKASSQSQGWLKSTKVANVDGGAIVQVTTQQKNPDGSYAVAEALTFVPGVNLDKDAEPRKLVSIYGNSPVLGAVERNTNDEKRYEYANYLQLLIEVQKSGHDVHIEINEVLEKFKNLI